MGIELVRIDDRLIHGQVVTAWVPQYKIEQILIINDDIRNNETQKAVFELMAPDGVIVRTFGVEEFTNIYKKTEIKRRTLLLLTDPKDALALVENNVELKQLNLGGIKYRPDRKQYTKAISLTDQEKIYLKKLSDMDVNVFVQMVPSDRLMSLKELLKEGGK